jgi:predicted PurR-regulated permease PerM
VPRVISFIVLLAIVLLVGTVFFQVMAQFIVPLFLASVLLVVFQPLHAWALKRLHGHRRLAALLTTVLILLAVLLPLTWLGWNAYLELHTLFYPGSGQFIAVADIEPETDMAASRVADEAPPVDPAADGEPLDGVETDDEALIDDAASDELADKEREKLNEWLTTTAFNLRNDLAKLTGIRVPDASVQNALQSIPSFVGAKVISGVQSAIGILIGLAIMVISLYYFLADGPAMIRTAMYLSPLDASYEKELLERFGDVSRAVVVATLLSAVVQGALAGLGYLFALPGDAPIFLLTALTMATSLVPFVGAAAVWVCVCGWVYLYGERVVDGEATQGDPVTAIFLAIYCAIVVSGIDNVIKPYILHGQSKLHPLLALLSILGGVQVLGPVGILVGPMLVSFLQALLYMLRKELDAFGGLDAKQLAGALDNEPPILIEPAAKETADVAMKKPKPAVKAATKTTGPRRTKRKRGH